MKTETLEKANRLSQRIIKLKDTLKNIEYCLDTKFEPLIKYIKCHSEEVLIEPYFKEEREINQEMSYLYLCLCKSQYEKRLNELEEELEKL
jgi:hypothetical protein